MSAPKGEGLRAGRLPKKGRKRLLRTAGGWVYFRDFEKPSRSAIDAARKEVQPS